MGLFDFLKKEKKRTKTIINSIGEFAFLKIDGTKNYQGKVRSKISDNIEILFPIGDESISIYQIEYFKRIENSWASIQKQLKIKDSKIDFSEYNIVSIVIPDRENEFYDMDAEIVLQKNKNILSVILKDLDVEEIIKI